SDRLKVRIRYVKNSILNSLAWGAPILSWQILDVDQPVFLIILVGN
ncbi:11164_t:CDS:1, partial [Racocetra persica]